MTTKQKIIEYLEEGGMFKRDAEAVFAEAIDSPLLSSAINWGGDAGQYPQQFYTGLFISLNVIAVEWIDANHPQAWYRSVFVDLPEPSGPAPKASSE